MTSPQWSLTITLSLPTYSSYSSQRSKLQLHFNAKILNNEFLRVVIDGCITRISINLWCYRTSLSPSAPVLLFAIASHSQPQSTATDRPSISCKRTVPFRGLIKTPLQFPPTDNAPPVQYHHHQEEHNLHYLASLIKTSPSPTLVNNQLSDSLGSAHSPWPDQTTSSRCSWARK